MQSVLKQLLTIIRCFLYIYRLERYHFSPDYTFITHWHQDLEFVVILEGHMTYSVNGIMAELNKNEGFMVNSRQIHSCFSSDRSDCTFICILLSLELFRNNDWFYENCIEPVTYNSDIPFLKLANSEWQEAAAQADAAHYLKKYLHDTPISYLTKLRLRKSLDGFLKEDVSITELAMNYGFNSSSYCCELFHRYYEQSPLQYRKEHKKTQDGLKCPVL